MAFISLDGVLLRAARCLGAQRGPLFANVILPGSLPHIFTGLAVGMGVAWVSLIAAEMISGQFGVGYFTWGSLLAGGLSRDRARHDHDRRPLTGFAAASSGWSASS